MKNWAKIKPRGVHWTGYPVVSSFHPFFLSPCPILVLQFFLPHKQVWQALSYTTCGLWHAWAQTATSRAESEQTFELIPVPSDFAWELAGWPDQVSAQDWLTWQSRNSETYGSELPLTAGGATIWSLKCFTWDKKKKCVHFLVLLYSLKTINCTNWKFIIRGSNQELQLPLLYLIFDQYRDFVN